MSRLRKAVRDYLTMRRGLGFKLVKHEVWLPEFVSFLARKRSSRITVNLALEWATQNTNHKPYDWAARLSISEWNATHSGSKSARGTGSGSKFPYSSVPRTSVALSRTPAVCRT